MWNRLWKNITRIGLGAGKTNKERKCSKGRKTAILVLGGLFLGSFMLGHEIRETQQLQKGIAKQVIRFHVLANSDDSKDQKLKEKVRDEVVIFLQKKLKNVKNKKEARKVIRRNLEEIKKISEKRLEQEGNYQPVTARITTCDFPVKSYGDTIFPSGIYETLQVEIGEANGHNWWCVMYPTLCMVDEGIAVVPEESKEKLRSTLNEAEYESIQLDHVTVKYKLKIVEFWEHLWD